MSIKLSDRESPYPMVSVDQALEIVLQETKALDVVTVPLQDALGLVVAETIVNQQPIPAFRASVMDGYAVVTSDGVGQYPVMERITAGKFPNHKLLPGQVSYITTGAPVPHGADAVVQIEHTRGVFKRGEANPKDENEIAVEILQPAKPNQFIRAIGSDLAVGAQLVQKQAVITPAEIGLLATAGISHVKVYRRPTIGVLSTGNELVDIESTTVDGDGTIRDSNRPMLLALLQQFATVQVVDLGILVDDVNTTRDKLTKALSQMDLLITSGGVSMGQFDFIKPFLAEHGHIHFGRVHMKPGKPTTFASVPMDSTKTFVFALPGNPVSCFVTFHLFVAPVLARLAGIDKSWCRLPLVQQVELTHALMVDPVRPEYHRARVFLDRSSGPNALQWKAISTSVGQTQPSSQLMNCHTANALLKIPVGTKPLVAGSRVDALLIGMESASAMALMTPLQVPPSQQDPEVLQHSGCACCAVGSGPSNVATTSSTLPTESTHAKFTFRVGILTISDRVARGTATDASGPMLAQLLTTLHAPTAGRHSVPCQFEIIHQACVPDEISSIQQVVKHWTELTHGDRVDLICTSGGTGLSPRDVTPEALGALFDKELPGFAMAMLQKGMEATPKAILSRAVCGIRHQTLIVTFPGKPNAIQENFEALKPVLGHALLLIRDEPHDHHVGRPSHPQ